MGNITNICVSGSPYCQQINSGHSTHKSLHAWSSTGIRPVPQIPVSISTMEWCYCMDCHLFVLEILTYTYHSLIRCSSILVVQMPEISQRHLLLWYVMLLGCCCFCWILFRYPILGMSCRFIVVNYFVLFKSHMVMESWEKYLLEQNKTKEINIDLQQKG